MQQKSIFNFELRAGRVFPKQKKNAKIKAFENAFLYIYGSVQETARESQESLQTEWLSRHEQG